MDSFVNDMINQLSCISYFWSLINTLGDQTVGLKLSHKDYSDVDKLHYAFMS